MLEEAEIRKGSEMDQEQGLIVFFSRQGNNYVGGRIVNLRTGNTEVLARIIQNITKCDLIKIQTVRTYPDDYTKATEVAREEQQGNARPELIKIAKDIGFFDVIYLGYPIWWGTMPMAVHTLLETYDFSGKTIAPFCTHEGSGLGRSEQDINRLCPMASVLPGLAVRGGNTANADREVARWLREIGLMPNVRGSKPPVKR